MKTFVRIFIAIVLTLVFLWAVMQCTPANKFNEKRCYHYYEITGYDSINRCRILKPLSYRDFKKKTSYVNIVWVKLDKCK